MLKRKIYNELCEWKKVSQGSSALLIEGARRVGKSFITEQFAKNEYKTHIVVDFSNATNKLIDMFENDSGDLNIFFEKLSVCITCRSKICQLSLS